MGKEIDDIEFDDLLADKRHKEITGRLGKLVEALNKPEKEKDDKAIVDAIKKQGESLDKVAAAIANQPKPEKSEVKVEVNNQEILPLLREIKEGNEKLLQAIENRNLVESFDFQYDNWGSIKTAKVNYKNQIPKPKYQA